MSALSPITSATLNAKSVSTPAASAAPSGGLGLQDSDFMTLLTAQMQYQNPMDPESSTDFMTQVAQLSQVDGINQLNQSISSLVSMQGLSQAANLIGANVSYTNAAGASVNGVVGSVAMASGQPQLVINGSQVGLSQVQTIS